MQNRVVSTRHKLLFGVLFLASLIGVPKRVAAQELSPCQFALLAQVNAASQAQLWLNGVGLALNVVAYWDSVEMTRFLTAEETTERETFFTSSIIGSGQAANYILEELYWIAFRLESC